MYKPIHNDLNKLHLERLDAHQYPVENRFEIPLYRLGILDNAEIFDSSVSYDTLSQLQITYTNIGNSDQSQNITKIDSELVEVKHKKDEFEDNFHRNKKSLEMTSKVQREMKEKISRNVTQRKEYAQMLKNSQNNLKHLQLDDKFLLNEKDKRRNLKEKSNSLTNKLSCCENISSDQDINKRILELQRKMKYQFLTFENDDYVNGRNYHH